MSVLLLIYLLYYLLAGAAGIFLYPSAVRICMVRFQDYLVAGPNTATLRGLLVSCAVVVACSAGVYFCFARVATLVAAVN